MTSTVAGNARHAVEPCANKSRPARVLRR